MTEVQKLLIATVLAVSIFPLSKPGSAEILTVATSDPFNFKEALESPTSDSALSIDVQLEFPETTAERVPVVLFVHGAGGPQPHHQAWLSSFRKQGYATAYANHFKPRGRSSAVGSHIRLTGAAMAADSLKILVALSEHGRIDKTKIAIMGASKGGGVALYTAWRPLQEAVAPGHRFAAHVALYPTCMHWDVFDFTGEPVQILLGDEDNWTGSEQCIQSASALSKQGGVPVQVKVYDCAHHGFDSNAELRQLGAAYNVTGCRFSLAPDGSDYANGLPLTTPSLKRAALMDCIMKGATYGRNEHAATSASMDVETFLKKVFAE